MTMPHLMNCPHQADGHCLDCVIQDYTMANGKIENLKAELASLNSVRYEHDAILKSPDGLMALMAIHDCKESEAEAFGDIGKACRFEPNLFNTSENASAKRFFRGCNVAGVFAT